MHPPDAPGHAGSQTADQLVMEPNTTPDLSTGCLCGERELLTIREVSDLPVMKHMSYDSLKRLVARDQFPHRRVTETKVLVLVTPHCAVHQTKAVDDVDTWLASMDPLLDTRPA